MGLFSRKSKEPTEIIGFLLLQICPGLKKGDFVKATYDGNTLFVGGSLLGSSFFYGSVTEEQLAKIIRIVPNNDMARRLYGQPSNVRC